MTGSLNHALKAPKEEIIVIINKRNVTQLANAVYPKCHSVLSFMVYAFQKVNSSSMRCIHRY